MNEHANIEALRAVIGGPVLELTAEMMLSAHLQPNFVRPSASRPPKQQWANWVKGWKPLSAQGKAAKRYSRACPSKKPRGAEYDYKQWLAARDAAA